MKLFKQISFAALLAMASFSAVIYSSCKTDKCKDVICQNGGTCAEGTCVCATGYEGSTCQNQERSKFIKSWNGHWVNVANPSLNASYTCSIFTGPASGTIGQVIIDNTFFQSLFVHQINATVSGSTITIPSQTPDGTDAISGSGTYSNGVITWNYSVIQGSVTKNYTDTFQ